MHGYHAAAHRRALAISAALLCVAGSHTANAEPRSYDARKADQFPTAELADIVPKSVPARVLHARNTAYAAAIFGQPAVLTYNQIYKQAIDRKSAGYIGFNKFAHGRDLAGPGYASFKTPNADTLYSNAYLDLSQGPVLLTIPATSGRYYTVNLLDLYSNATNISARTHGMAGGRYLIVTTDWGGEVPEGATLFRVTQPFMWILLRIEAENADVVPQVRKLQDAFKIEPLSTSASVAREFPAPATLKDPAAFLKVLDWVVEEAGVRNEELAHVHSFRSIGVGGSLTVDQALADVATRQGVQNGFAEAATVIEVSISQNGKKIAGWNEPVDVGRFDLNYLYRAGSNTLGTGANVRVENFPFTTFEDAQSEPLDGSKHEYVLRFDSPPPADFFWSVTAYDLRTKELFPNSARKYLVGDNTEGLVKGADGSVTITLSREAKGPNAIPIPNGPFYLALRAQGPQRTLMDGTWRPLPVQKVPN